MIQGTRVHHATALAALGLLLLLAAAAAGCRTSAAMCPACERTECRNMAFTIHPTSGKPIETCCPRCALHYMASHHPSVASLTVRAFETAASLDATRAFYVEGSDVTPCTSVSSDGARPKDERGCCLNPVYDRCLPSLLAFGDREDAERFAREHGGAVRLFEELRPARTPARG